MESPSHIGAFMLVLALASIVLGVSTSGSEAFPEPSSAAVLNRRSTTSAELKGDIEDLDVAEQNYGNGGGYGNRPYGNNGGRGKGAHVTLNGPFGSYVAAGIGGDKGGNNGGGGGGIFGNGGGIFGNNGNGGGIFGNNGNGAGYYGNNGYGNGGGYYGNNGAGRPGFFNRFFGR